jgi:hypothetical protein
MWICSVVRRAYLEEKFKEKNEPKKKKKVSEEQRRLFENVLAS